MIVAIDSSRERTKNDTRGSVEDDVYSLVSQSKFKVVRSQQLTSFLSRDS